ncbi:hypothetical protein OG21DRAFT_1586761 [Imleria badia]|nr:hypothetical protein OG21DRAFT_1586761 [Imleria badia]
MKIHLMTMYESPYEYLPTLSVGVPKIPAILARWRRLVTQDATLLQHPAPFVREYFSIHILMYPGIQQLCSGLSWLLAVAASRRSAYHSYHHRHVLNVPLQKVIKLKTKNFEDIMIIIPLIPPLLARQDSHVPTVDASPSRQTGPVLPQFMQSLWPELHAKCAAGAYHGVILKYDGWGRQGYCNEQHRGNVEGWDNFGRALVTNILHLREAQAAAADGVDELDDAIGNAI